MAFWIENRPRVCHANNEIMKKKITLIGAGQIGGTFEGGLVLLCSSLPGDLLEPIAGDLSEPGPWFWPLGGGISTAAAVWLLMSNTKILIFILNIFLSRFSGLKAVTKTAISYPMASKFRTGLTVAMFALIIFTLMIWKKLLQLRMILKPVLFG